MPLGQVNDHIVPATYGARYLFFRRRQVDDHIVFGGDDFEAGGVGGALGDLVRAGLDDAHAEMGQDGLAGLHLPDDFDNIVDAEVEGVGGVFGRFADHIDDEYVRADVRLDELGEESGVD